MVTLLSFAVAHYESRSIFIAQVGILLYVGFYFVFESSYEHTLGSGANEFI
jgi:hypothetical protein